MNKRLQIILFQFSFLFFISASVLADDISQLEKQIQKAEPAAKSEMLIELSKQYVTIDINKAQSVAEQALKQAQTIKDQMQEAAAYHNLGRLYMSIGDKTKAIAYFRKAYNLRKSISDFKGLNQTAINIGTYYQEIGKNDLAQDYYLEALDGAIKAPYEKGQGIAYLQLGNLRNNQAKYQEALEYYQSALKIFDKIGFEDGVASSMNNIGFMYQNLNKKADALKYFKMALKFSEGLKNYKAIGDALNNCGNIYGLKPDRTKEPDTSQYYLYMPDSAAWYFGQAIINFEKVGYKKGIVSATANIGLEYMYLGQFDKALSNLNKALALNEEVNDTYEFSSIYRGMGLVYYYKKDYNNAILYFKKGLVVSDKLGFKEHIMMNNRFLSESYEGMEEYKPALEYLKKYIYFQEELRGKQQDKILQEMETKYETVKKEQQLQIANKENDFQKKIIYFALIGGAIVFIFLVIMSIQFIQKRRANKILSEKNIEIMLQKEEIEAQRDEIELQKDQVEQQKNLIEEQQKGIMDSIHYARRIQEAILPQHDTIQEINPNSFVLFKPRDVVSGDFYWMGQKGNKNMIIAADCTGHGVPGAFMSMLGTAFLNEITGSTNELSSDAILNELRAHVITSLKQTGKQGEQKDGMDLVLYQYDRDSLELEFAGANNPLVIIRKTVHHTISFDNPRISEEESTNDTTGESYTIIQLKADKMPIGIYAEQRPFASIKLQLMPGDALYSFSDGYIDQFGGAQGKKYLIKRFKKFLVNIQHIAIVDQKGLLDTELLEWRGEGEQIDDIIVIGIQV